MMPVLVVVAYASSPPPLSEPDAVTEEVTVVLPSTYSVTAIVVSSPDGDCMVVV